MKNRESSSAPLSQQEPTPSGWSASRRRPVFLLILVAGLALFLAWLPDETRSSLWTALRAQRGLVVLLLVFALVTVSLVWSLGQRLDAWVFTSLNARRYPAWLDRGMWLTTNLGNMLAAFAAALVLFLVHDRVVAVEIIFGTLTLWLLVELIKALSERDRPFLTLDTTRVIGWREKGDSFPSGHTTQVFFLAALLIHHFDLGFGAALGIYALAALVGITRVYIGVHYPRDVLAGMVLGSVWGILMNLLDPYWLALRL